MQSLGQNSARVSGAALLLACSGMLGIGCSGHIDGGGAGGAPSAGTGGAEAGAPPNESGRSGVGEGMGGAEAGAGAVDDAGAGGNAEGSTEPLSAGTAGVAGGGTTSGGGSGGGAGATASVCGIAGAGTGGGSVCSNDIVEPDEGCDQGNQTPGDGCSATCTVESGWVCSTTGTHSVCNRSCFGASGSECQGLDCCASPLVIGGTFTQGRADSGSGTFQSTVSSFRLDKFEVTVGRFRRFLAAYESWRGAGNPASNAGAHPSIPGSGWSPTWTSLPTNPAQLEARVACPASIGGTWLGGAGNDTLPINCTWWDVAFAFCIWDGGRLPTDSEWEYAAAGGSNNYLYPWGNLPIPSNSQDWTAAYATYRCLGDGSAGGDCTFADILPVGSKPLGQGLFGQRDLAGSMWEWTLDFFAPYPTSPQTNYAKVDTGTQRAFRGGDYGSASYAPLLTATSRQHFGELIPWANNSVGFRCAREP